jgi:hypothetical protein
MLAFGSHNSPFAHSAELTAGVAIVTAAIGASATVTTSTTSRTNVLIAGLPLVCSALAAAPASPQCASVRLAGGVFIIEPSPGIEVKTVTCAIEPRIGPSRLMPREARLP